MTPYPAQEANWNVTALVDPSGTVLERYQYDPYGRVTFLTPTWGSRNYGGNYGFGNFVQDAAADIATRTANFRHRTYNWEMMRWLQQDDAYRDGANLYAMENNDPVSGLDPTGRVDWGNLFGGVWQGKITIACNCRPGSGNGSPTIAIYPEDNKGKQSAWFVPKSVGGYYADAFAIQGVDEKITYYKIKHNANDIWISCDSPGSWRLIDPGDNVVDITWDIGMAPNPPPNPPGHWAFPPVPWKDIPKGL